MKRKEIFSVIVVFAVTLAFMLPTSAMFANDTTNDITNDVTTVQVTKVRFEPPSQTVETGETFTASYYIEPTDWIIGANFVTISFDPTLLQANSVTKGTFFNGNELLWNGGTIDNVAGTISDGYALVLPVDAVNTPGSVFVITFTAKDTFGISDLVMSGVTVKNNTGKSVPITVESGSVTVRTEGYFDLTIGVVSSGTTDPLPGTYSYISGTVVDLEAIPDVGWSFDHWDGDVADPSSAITNITMDDDEDVTATFTDTTPPITTCILDPPEPDGDNGWYISIVKVTLNATDEGSGVESTWYKVYDVYWKLYTGPFSVSQEGEHTLEYYSFDHANNIEPTKKVEFKIDTKLPTTTHEFDGIIGEGGWFISNVTVTLFAADMGSGLNYTKYKLNDGEWIIYEEDSFVVTEDGDYMLYYYSADFAGNMEDVKGPFEFKIEKDLTPPETMHEFDGVMGDNGWYTSNVVVRLTAEDDSSGVDYTMYKLDDDDWIKKEYQGPFTFLVSEDGEHTIKYYSVDKIGNKEVDKGPFDFKIDQTKPTINLTWDGENSKLVADVSDETSGIAKVEFYVNGEYLGEATSSPYEYEVPNPRTGDKGQAIVYDNAGNQELSEEIDAVPQSQSQGSSSTSTPFSWLIVKQK